MLFHFGNKEQLLLALLEWVLAATTVAGRACQLAFTGESNRFYHLQATTNWVTWLELFVTNLPGAYGTFIDTQAVALGNRFYRIQVGP